MDIAKRQRYTTYSAMLEIPFNNDHKGQLQTNFNTNCIGNTVYYYPEVESTNLTARQLVKEGAAEGSIVIAGKQMAGRGRLQRTWFTPEGNLAVSIILKPSLVYLPQLIMMASLSVARTIHRICGITARIKWPNDVLINSKKVCGILIESEVKKSIVNYSVIGIGINVNLDISLYPDIEPLATSLSHEKGTDISINSLLNVLVTELDDLYIKVKKGDSLHMDWQKNMETIGRQIQVRSGDSIETGTAESTTENGSLILRRQDGNIVEIMAGDVTLLKN
jgi:BirA family biotin operon repressor/biotin-[acetyl-CoA-carboxylase] ligase